MPRYLSNGADIYYAVDGEGPPVILLHCLPLDHRVWVHQIFDLVPRFRTFAIDFRGLGLSERTTGPCSMDMLASDVNNLMETEGIGSAAVIGVSLGGVVSLQFAVNYPEKVRALVVSGCTYTARLDDAKRGFTQRATGFRSSNGRSYYVDMVRGLFSPEFAASKRGGSVIGNYSALVGGLNLESIARLFEGLSGVDLKDDELKGITAPTLAIAGEKDSAFERTRRITRYLPNSRFVSIPGAGHAVCLESPIEYDAELLPFLRGEGAP